MSERERPFLRRNFAIVAAFIVAVIIYGSLYPFAFRVPDEHTGMIANFLRTWADKPGRGDFIANILLYMPLGYFALLAINPRISAPSRLTIATLAGALLSLCMELTQYYDAGRDSTLTDFYSNALGTVFGAIAGILVGERWRWPLLEDAPARREPAALLVAWLGYWLFPYVPVIDLHKYWDALKPVVLYPSLTPYDLFRHTAIWLAVYALFSAVLRRWRPDLLIPFFVGAMLFAKILILGAVLSVGEIAGAALAFALWILLGANARLRSLAIAALFLMVVGADRLEPFQFGAAARPFQWIPFYGFMRGSIDIDVQSFFEKFFLYGSLIWLLVQNGLRLGLAAAAVALLLLATSWLETYLPGRSAEITDAVMALAIAAIAALTKPSEARATGKI